MKIIQSSRKIKKDDSPSASENRADERDGYVHTVTVDPSTRASEPKPKEWKPRSKKKRSSSSGKRSKFQKTDSKPVFGSAACDSEFEFDTRNLEAMPKDEVIEGPSKGKTRRRSELLAEKNSEPLSLIVDPAKKEFNELFARGLRLLAMREHSVKELTKKLFDKLESSSRTEVSSRAEVSSKDEGTDNAEGTDGDGGFDNAECSDAECSDSAEGSDLSEGADVIYAVVDDLLEKKYLCDERFTEVYIRSRRNRGFGPVKIKAELKNKGVSNHLIQDYLDQGAAVWFDNAKSEYHKKYGNTQIDDYSTWAKRARFLQSRGFNMDQIHCAVSPVEKY